MNIENDRIQRIEVPWNSEAIYCPFCTQKVMDFDLGLPEGSNMTPCSHTIFIATDYGFEYTSTWFGNFIAAEQIYRESEDESIDVLTDDICLPTAVKYARYQPAPNFFGDYFGFMDQVMSASPHESE
jgi:hypothetical protein